MTEEGGGVGINSGGGGGGGVGGEFEGILLSERGCVLFIGDVCIIDP